MLQSVKQTPHKPLKIVSSKPQLAMKSLNRMSNAAPVVSSRSNPSSHQDTFQKKDFLRLLDEINLNSDEGRS